MLRELGDSQQQSAPADEAFVSEIKEAALLQATHNDVSAAKNLKIKLKIENKKKHEDSRKNYEAVIHNMVAYTAKLAVAKPKQGVAL